MALALLALLGAGCSQLEERTLVRGQVCVGSCADGNWLKGARVALNLLGEPGASDRPTRLTDGQGRFVFPSASTAGRYLLEVHHSGFECDAVEPAALAVKPIEITCRTDTTTLVANGACGQDLRDAVLTDAELAGVDLTGANLARVSLIEADLTGATLTGADLSDARLASAALVRADLSGRALGCDVASALGEPTRLVRASLRGADLSLARLNEADLTEANLAQASLEGSDLTDALMGGANLSGSRVGALLGCPAQAPDGWRCLELGGGVFALVGPGAELSDVDLTGLDLSGVNLAGATLTRADLSGTGLVGADLSGADLTGALLAGARPFDLKGCPARLPAGWRCVPQPRDASLGRARVALVGPGADLSGADLSGADLSTMDLTDVALRGSTLSQVNLSQTTLTGLSAHGLSGSCPRATPAPWRCAERSRGEASALIGPTANLAGARLAGVDLTDADLRGADLTRADLSRAILVRADLRDAHIGASSLTGARMTHAVTHSLHGCPSAFGLPAHDPSDPEQASPCAIAQTPWRCVEQPALERLALVGPTADLTGAVFVNTDFGAADLTSALLLRANLQGADLSRARLDCAQWRGATCPDGTPSDQTQDSTCEAHRTP